MLQIRNPRLHLNMDMDATNSSKHDKVEKETVFASCSYDYVDRDIIAELATADTIDSWYGGALLTPLLFFVVAVLTQPFRMLMFAMEARLPALLVLAVLLSSTFAAVVGMRVRRKNIMDESMRVGGNISGWREARCSLGPQTVLFQEKGVGGETAVARLRNVDCTSVTHTDNYIVLRFAGGQIVPIRKSALEEADPGMRGYRAWYQKTPRHNEGLSLKTVAVGVAAAVIIMLLFALVGLMASRA